MITLPDGFDPSVLISDFFTLTAPFLGVAFLITCGFLILNFLKKM
jgi:hypothetical protein